MNKRGENKANVEKLRDLMAREHAATVKAWAVAVMNAAALVAMQAVLAHTFDSEAAEQFNTCAEELLCAFERMPAPAEGE